MGVPIGFAYAPPAIRRRPDCEATHLAGSQAVLAELEDATSVLQLAPLDRDVALGLSLVSSDRAIRASGHRVIW